MDDIHSFKFSGYYYTDILTEIGYWEDAVEDPEEYEVDPDVASDELNGWLALKVRFVEAFDKQRPSKVDYEDGTWV